MSNIKGLGWEQLVALRVLRGEPGIEGAALCAQADMSFDEFYALGQRGLIDVGMERLQPKSAHPVLLPAGEVALNEAIESGAL